VQLIHQKSLKDMLMKKLFLYGPSTQTYVSFHILTYVLELTTPFQLHYTTIKKTHHMASLIVFHSLMHSVFRNSSKYPNIQGRSDVQFVQEKTLAPGPYRALYA